MLWSKLIGVGCLYDLIEYILRKDNGEGWGSYTSTSKYSSLRSLASYPVQRIWFVEPCISLTNRIRK